MNTKKTRGKTLQEWKEYSNKDKNIPIRTAKYISILEELIEQCAINGVSKSFKDKYTPTFEDFLIQVKGFEINKTETYINELQENYYKYTSQYRHWLKTQP
jgi:hypothetical protein